MTIVAMLLAGGQGSRLSILSQRRAKPAVPFGGSYRIIDFTLSNIMHAGIPYCGILTQYKPYSLMDHIGSGDWWGFTGRERMCRVLPPYTGEDESDWYAGTADAIWQNVNFIERFVIAVHLAKPNAPDNSDQNWRRNHEGRLFSQQRRDFQRSRSCQPRWLRTARATASG